MKFVHLINDLYVNPEHVAAVEAQKNRDIVLIIASSPHIVHLGPFKDDQELSDVMTMILGKLTGSTGKLSKKPEFPPFIIKKGE